MNDKLQASNTSNNLEVQCGQRISGLFLNFVHFQES